LEEEEEEACKHSAPQQLLALVSVKPSHHQPPHQHQYLALLFQLWRRLLHRQHQHLPPLQQLGRLLGLPLVALKLVLVKPNHPQPPQQLQYLALLQQLGQGFLYHQHQHLPLLQQLAGLLGLRLQ
jgi:hypothetical protein